MGKKYKYKKKDLKIDIPDPENNKPDVIQKDNNAKFNFESPKIKTPHNTPIENKEDIQALSFAYRYFWSWFY